MMVLADITITEDSDSGWSLVVTEDGEVEARKTIPYDGVRYFSTVDRPNRADKTSQFRLDVEDVVRHYAEKSASETPVSELLADVQSMLMAVRSIESEDDHVTSQVDVCIDADTWARIWADARENYRGGKEPNLAYWDAVNEHVTTIPNLIVDGEVKGPGDIDGLPQPESEGSSE